MSCSGIGVLSLHRKFTLLLRAGRSSDLKTRQKYVALAESVKELGGTVHVFSTLHVSGERMLFSVK